MNEDNTPTTTGEGYQLLQEQAREAGIQLGQPQVQQHTLPVLPVTGADLEIVGISLLPTVILVVALFALINRVRHAHARRLP